MDKLDLRVRKTRELIQKTLIDLIEEKGFDAVTIGDIAQRAKINRSTFYRHYPDKYALVTNIFKDAVKQLTAELGQERAEALDWIINSFEKKARQLNPEMEKIINAWVAFFEHFSKHSKLYRSMLGRQGSTWFAIQMRNYTASTLRNRFHLSPWHQSWKKNKFNSIPEEFFVVSLANWIVGIISWWLEDGVNCSAYQMAIWSLQIVAQGYVSTMGINPTTLPR